MATRIQPTLDQNAVPPSATKAIRGESENKGPPSRSPFGGGSGSSGLDGAMAELADRLHPVS